MEVEDLKTPVLTNYLDFENTCIANTNQGD